MCVSSRNHTIQLVKIQLEERLSATSEPNLVPSLVTGCCETNEGRFWTATQVKGLISEITIVSVADVVHLTEGSTRVIDSRRSWNISESSGTWSGDESPTGSETVVLYQRDTMGSWESQNVLPNEVCDIKPINCEILQTTLCESDQLIVAKKQGNAYGGVRMVREPLGQGHIFCSLRQSKDANKTGLITYPENGGEVLQKSKMRGDLKSGAVMGFTAALGWWWL